MIVYNSLIGLTVLFPMREVLEFSTALSGKKMPKRFYGGIVNVVGMGGRLMVKKLLQRSERGYCGLQGDI